MKFKCFQKKNCQFSPHIYHFKLKTPKLPSFSTDLPPNSRKILKTQEINSKLKEKVPFSGISEASKSWRSAQKKACCKAITLFRHNTQTKCGVITLFPHMPLFRHQRVTTNPTFVILMNLQLLRHHLSNISAKNI